jgi:hypothetical protein
MGWFLFLIFFLEYPADIMGDKKTRQAFPKAKMLAPERSFRAAQEPAFHFINARL